MSEPAGGPGGRPRAFVAGHRGMVGRAIVRELERRGGAELVVAGREALDLADARAVDRFFAGAGIDEVYLAAAKVGGIAANDAYPVDFLAENLAIQQNVIGAAHAHGVRRLLFLGSSCIYPKLAGQPIVEESLLTGPLEPTNRPYALAKIAGIELCDAHRRQHGRDYRAVMPTNLYGPFDNFHPEHSHVIPGLLGRFDAARRDGAAAVTLWGTGTPMREFLHVDDMAAASVHVMGLGADAYERALAAVRPDGAGGPRTTHLNVGTGEDCTIAELARAVARVTGFDGELEFDVSRPDGTPRKLLDVSALHATGWRHRIGLDEGLEATRRWFLEHRDSLRGDR